MTPSRPPGDNPPAAAEGLRQDALLAEGRGDWRGAADLWSARARATRGAAWRTSSQRAVRALLAAGETDRAEAACRALLDAAPTDPAWLRLHAETAVTAGAWVAALKRWRRLQDAAPDDSGPLPADWVFRIGPDRALRRTEASPDSGPDSGLRATGMLALAGALQAVDEVAALGLARRARAALPAQAIAQAARILAAGGRHGAAIWWLRRLTLLSVEPSPHLPALVESLLEAGRLEACADLLAGHDARHGRDRLWLRGMLELHYRQGDLAALQALMDAAAAEPLPARFRAVRVTGWLGELIRHHPAPQDFLPEGLRDPALRLAKAHDSKAQATDLTLLLDPARAATAAAAHADRIAAAGRGEEAIDPAERAGMLQVFLRRRDWDRVAALVALPLPNRLPDHLTAQDAGKLWQLLRATLDVRLGQGDVAGAEAVAVAFLDRLAAAGLDGLALDQARALIWRLPLSMPLARRLQAAARRAGFSALAGRIADWRARYGGIDPAAWTGCARQRRCVIVGNGPSLARLPLAALAGQDIFCVNRGLRARDLGLPAPRYLVVADPHVYKNHAHEIEADGAAVETFFATARCLWQRPPRVPAIPLGLSGLKLSLAPFRHAALHLHPGESVVVLAAQLAHLMGYREINIIGVDLDYAGPATHFYGGGRKEGERLASFRPGGAGAEMVNLALASLQAAVAADGCRLRNATPGGRLDALERVDFQRILGQDPLHD